MQIQINTDRHVQGKDSWSSSVEAELRDKLQRFAGRITRIELHLGDVNADRDSDDDMRCMIEARLANRQPISVSEQAATRGQAVNGAIGKLQSALDTIFGKTLAARRAPRPGKSPP
jgi:hypothetical protein